MITLITQLTDYFETLKQSKTTDPSGINFSFVLDFEKHYDRSDTLNYPILRDLKTFMIEQWHNSFFYAIVYLLLIYTGQIYMKTRPRFELRSALTFWNILLALFSIFGAIRVIPEIIYVLYKHGFTYSICNNSNAFGVTGFWTWAFCFAKLPELIDTVFIVLRKQPLIFLHYYHHATVLIYCWYSYHDLTASGRWFCSMNSLVHAIMYTYYALRALRFKIPRYVSMVITLLQLLQMIIGCYINLKIWDIKKNGETCQVSDDNLKYSMIMYATYFLLFAHFFASAYIKPSSLTIRGTHLENDKIKSE
ncbi:unnamed protein product [Didymodactylos carnosus]|uniref:Elongation of very long chain fatty acids protein n=1 Tax=Didymodactylos carnosus TaxID=1234261 RepID=A0A815MGT9_9BILA|nr:unnamed protein product [Didymodactylos carnosus]CAF1421401.1 unnamed protein product [Didymodactylos carnosus]CAF4074312.1 unnamed protein product [Didymodactylos carnosus]CAF4304424.1 unnamed protein product [Didymodactylos carnosus]